MAINTTQSFPLNSYQLRFYGKSEQEVIDELNKYIQATPRIVEWVPAELKKVDLGSTLLVSDEYTLAVDFVRVSNVVRHADGTAGLQE